MTADANKTNKDYSFVRPSSLNQLSQRVDPFSNRKPMKKSGITWINDITERSSRSHVKLNNPYCIAVVNPFESNWTKDIRNLVVKTVNRCLDVRWQLFGEPPIHKRIASASDTFDDYISGAVYY